MIYSFKMLGNSILNRIGYYEAEDEIQKRALFLEQLSIYPSDKNSEKSQYALAIHFDLNKERFWFELDKEIVPGNRGYFFAFSYSGTPKAKKKFLATTFNIKKLDGFFEKLFDDSATYLSDCRKDKCCGEWFSENVSTGYDDLIKEVKDKFYISKGKVWELDRTKLLEVDKRELCKDEKKLLKKNKKNKSNTTPITVVRLLTEFIARFFFKEVKGDGKYPPIILAKINGKHIMEDAKRRIDYINMVYFDQFERFFLKEGVPGKRCHICDKNRHVANKASLPMKFYGTTNNLYFENLSTGQCYKSFAICRDCLREVLAGIHYTMAELKERILNIDCCLIPSMETPDPNYKEAYWMILKLLHTRRGYTEDIEKIDRLLRRAQKSDLRFHLLFFSKNKQEFNILKFIPDLAYRSLAGKLKKFNEFENHYEFFLLHEAHLLGLTQIRYLLFPSKSSHEKPDPKTYRKDLLDFLEAFLNERSFNYHALIRRFVTINRLRFHHKKKKAAGSREDPLAAFKMVIVLSILHSIKPLQGVTLMEGGSVTEIQNRKYKAFFKKHEEIYGDNAFRQGLFLLGTVINRIASEQYKKAREKAGPTARKTGESGTDNDKHRVKFPTFLKKLNFAGVPPRRVVPLVNQAREYALIYEVYEDAALWANLTDRLQGIERSAMKGEEVVFYILTGYAYERYLVMKKKSEKEQEDGDNK